jgi:hypothetical protein
LLSYQNLLQHFIIFSYHFVCSSICNKAFTQLANLQRHNLVHNGVYLIHQFVNVIAIVIFLSLSCYRFETVQVSNMSEGIQPTRQHGEASNVAYRREGKHKFNKINLIS